MRVPEAVFEAFDRLLAREGGPWAEAKRDAFARLRDAFPGSRGPTHAGLRQIERGQFDARMPDEWKPVFTEVYHQWLGFVAEERALGAPPAFSLAWWFRPGYTHGLPQGTRWMGSPGMLAAVLFVLLALRCTHGMTIRREAARAIEVVAASAAVASRELGDAELAARGSFAAPSDAALSAFLAEEPSLRSRYESATQRNEELARRIEDAEAALVASRFPRWPRQPVGH
jgi:hypothetical protein